MPDYEITPQQVAQLVAEKGTSIAGTGPVLLDVREPVEHQIAHIEGSILMPMGDVPGRAFQELDPGAHIIAICHHGVRSMNVAVWLRNQGFENAQSLRGGIEAWAVTVDPSMPRY
jgi:rhodanese-related sulfurtransferase